MAREVFDSIVLHSFAHDHSGTSHNYVFISLRDVLLAVICYYSFTVSNTIELTATYTEAFGITLTLLWYVDILMH